MAARPASAGNRVDTHSANRFTFARKGIRPFAVRGPGHPEPASEFCQVVSRFNGLPGRKSDNFGMRIRLHFTLFALASGIAVADSPDANGDSLYARLGGTTKVTAFVEAMLEHAPIGGADRALERDRWVAKICALSGGDCDVADADGRTPLVPVEDLRRAMRAYQVPLAARNQLLERLAGH
jgi:hypothetical protein